MRYLLRFILLSKQAEIIKILITIQELIIIEYC